MSTPSSAASPLESSASRATVATPTGPGQLPTPTCKRGDLTRSPPPPLAHSPIIAAASPVPNKARKVLGLVSSEVPGSPPWSPTPTSDWPVASGQLLTTLNLDAPVTLSPPLGSHKHLAPLKVSPAGGVASRPPSFDQGLSSDLTQHVAPHREQALHRRYSSVGSDTSFASLESDPREFERGTSLATHIHPVGTYTPTTQDATHTMQRERASDGQVYAHHCLNGNHYHHHYPQSQVSHAPLARSLSPLIQTGARPSLHRLTPASPVTPVTPLTPMPLVHPSFPVKAILLSPRSQHLLRHSRGGGGDRDDGLMPFLRLPSSAVDTPVHMTPHSPATPATHSPMSLTPSPTPSQMQHHGHALSHSHGHGHLHLPSLSASSSSIQDVSRSLLHLAVADGSIVARARASSDATAFRSPPSASGSAFSAESDSDGYLSPLRRPRRAVMKLAVTTLQRQSSEPLAGDADTESHHTAAWQAARHERSRSSVSDATSVGSSPVMSPKARALLFGKARDKVADVTGVPMRELVLAQNGGGAIDGLHSSPLLYGGTVAGAQAQLEYMQLHALSRSPHHGHRAPRSHYRAASTSVTGSGTSSEQPS